MNKKQLISAIIACLVVLTGYAFASIDLNNPLQPPYQYRGEKDTNGDGVRNKVYYKHSNNESLLEDIDFDGAFDQITYYENEVLIKKEVDTDKDGEWDLRFWYKDGEVERVENSQ